MRAESTWGYGPVSSTIHSLIQGVKYYEGFAVNCIRDTYLKDHDAPEDCEYYLCGPPMLIKTVTDYLDSLGVDPESIMYDNFG